MLDSVGATSVSNTLHLGSDTIADNATGDRRSVTDRCCIKGVLPVSRQVHVTY